MVFRRARFVVAGVALAAAGGSARAAGTGVELPAEVGRFVEPGTRAIDFVAADLDADGREDGLLVLEELSPRDPEAPGSLERILVLLARTAEGALEHAVRNERAIYCSDCGGAMGDPYVGIEPEPRGFTIRHYGGSAWRWGIEATFAADGAGGPWRLRRVATTSFHAQDPDEPEPEVVEAPDALEPVDLRDFELHAWSERYRK